MYCQPNTITIFVASSFEMRTDRIALGDCIRRLDSNYESRGVRIRLNCWEDYTPEYKGERKQDEYNRDLVVRSQIVVGLFKSICGKYTQEEIKLSIETKGLEQVHCYYRVAPEMQSLGGDIANFFHENHINALPYRTSDDICQEITSIIEKYVESHYTICNLPTIAVPTSNIYATIPDDLQFYVPEVGNIIRQLDYICETNFGTRCKLCTLKSSQNICCSDYFITIFDKKYSEYDIYELTQANMARSIGVMNALAIYSLPTANISGNKLQDLLTLWGYFSIRLDNLDILKLNTLIYLISQLNSKESFSVRNFISIHNNQIQCFGHYLAPISALDSLRDGVLTHVITDLDVILTKIQAIEQASSGKIFENPTQEYLHLLESKVSLETQLTQYTYIIIDFLLKDTNNTIKTNKRLRTLYKEGQYSTIINEINTENLIRLATQDIKVIDNRKKTIDAIYEQFDIKIRSILNILISNPRNESNIDELRKTLEGKLSVQESAYKYQIVSIKDILRTLYLQIQVADTWGSYTPDEEDILYKKVITYADYGNFSDLAIENVRSNYANALARHQNNQEAANQYEIAISNILSFNENTRVARKIVCQIYMNYVSCYDAFYDDSHTAVLNRWKSLVEKYIIEDSSFIVEMLKIYTKEIQHLPHSSALNVELITKAEQILQEVVQNFNNQDDKDQYDLIYASIVVACYYIDRFFNNRNYCYDKASFYLNMAIKLCHEYEKKAFLAAIQYRSQINHNKGLLLTLIGNWIEAETYYLKAYNDRKLEVSLYPNVDTQANLAETSINYSDCLLHLSRYNDAIEYAKEAIALYNSMLQIEYEHTYMNFYRAKQMLGSIYIHMPQKKEDGLQLLEECWQWASSHSNNKHIDIFKRVSYKILKANGSLA